MSSRFIEFSAVSVNAGQNVRVIYNVDRIIGIIQVKDEATGKLVTAVKMHGTVSAEMFADENGELFHWLSYSLQSEEMTVNENVP
ncbi:MAG: hypothetical protein JWO15_3528 [Sphingomonadales bacterium]|nr:hypothetical protein [Sphingomonadales bacterium]